MINSEITIISAEKKIIKNIENAVMEKGEAKVRFSYDMGSLYRERIAGNKRIAVLHLMETNGYDIDFDKIKVPFIILTDQPDNDHVKEENNPALVEIIDITSLEYLDYLSYLVIRVFKNQDVKILIVEDSVLSREMLKYGLSRLRFQIIEAATGVEALSRLEDDVKLVVTDYWMPGMNGDELIRKIRGRFSRNEMSIMVISSLKDKKKIPSFLKIGANDYIEKPYTYEELMVRVHNLIENQEAYEINRRLTYMDSLTRLYNRHYYAHFIKKIFPRHIENQTGLYCAMVDIDHFKKINDDYGHDAGDVAIKALSGQLIEKFDNRDSAIVRWGGEEFIILSWKTKEDYFKRNCESLRKSIEDFYFSYNRHEISYTISIGASRLAPRELVENLITRCDSLLYQAKSQGRNRLVYS